MPFCHMASFGKQVRGQAFVRAWVRHDGRIAVPRAGGWTFVDPKSSAESEPFEGTPLAFAPDGRWAHFSPPGAQPDVVLYRPDGSTAPLEAEANHTSSLTFLGRWVVRWDHLGGGAFLVHDADTGRQVGVLRGPHKAGEYPPPLALRPGADGRTMVVCDQTQLHLWDLEALRVERTLELPEGFAPTEGLPMPGGRLLAVRGSGRTRHRLLLLDEAGRPSAEYKPDKSEQFHVAPLGEGFVVVTGKVRQPLLVVLGPDLAVRETLEVQLEDMLGLPAPLPSGEAVLVGGSHGQVHLFGWGEPLAQAEPAPAPRRAKR